MWMAKEEMKTRNKIILIISILIVGLIVIPSGISIISPIYCNNMHYAECEIYSISLIPNFRPFVDTVLDKEEGQRQYDTTPATCNAIITGKPNGQCFVNAFEKCEHASIKNTVSTIEGDPVFLYAYIDIDDCKIRHSVDLRLDKFSNISDQTFQSTICTQVQSGDHNLSFQCGDEQRMLPLR